MKISTATFGKGYHTSEIMPVYQWNYGQVLRVQGLNLPTAVEIHFAVEGAAETITRVGTTKDGVTDVTIPDSMLEQPGCFFAYIYLTDDTSGQTEYVISGEVKGRPKPEAFDTPDDTELFRDVIKIVDDSAKQAGVHEKNAERWAIGREDVPESLNDNAKYYSEQAADSLKEISGEVKDAKKHIEDFAREKEIELKGDTGNVYFPSFRVVKGRLKMYSDPTVTKVVFRRTGSRLKYRVQIGGQ